MIGLDPLPSTHCPEFWGSHRQRVVTASAPFRVDLAGGWTDTSPIAESIGGCVLNCGVEIDHQRLSVTAGRGEGSPTGLAQAILRVANTGEPIVLSLHSPFAAGTGLGVSSILALCGLRAVRALLGQPTRTDELLEQVVAVEQLMGTDGGWQDQWGAVGGLNLLMSMPVPAPERRGAPPTAVPVQCAGLQQRLILADTRKPRLAADILHEVTRRFAAGELREELEALRVLALQMARAIARQDWRAAVQMISGVNRINSNITGTPASDMIGSKYCGAGGGGFVVGIVEEPAMRPQAEQQMRERGWEVHRAVISHAGLAHEVHP